MIMSTTVILTVAVGGGPVPVPRRSQGYCKGRDRWGDDTLILIVDAKASPQTLNSPKYLDPEIRGFPSTYTRVSCA